MLPELFHLRLIPAVAAAAAAVATTDAAALHSPSESEPLSFFLSLSALLS